MTVSAAEAVAAIEAIERYGLSVVFTGTRHEARDMVGTKFAIGATPVESVAMWMELYTIRGWPVTAAEAEETP